MLNFPCFLICTENPNSTAETVTANQAVRVQMMAEYGNGFVIFSVLSL